MILSLPSCSASLSDGHEGPEDVSLESSFLSSRSDRASIANLKSRCGCSSYSSSVIMASASRVGRVEKCSSMLFLHPISRFNRLVSTFNSIFHSRLNFPDVWLDLLCEVVCDNVGGENRDVLLAVVFAVYIVLPGTPSSNAVSGGLVALFINFGFEFSCTRFSCSCSSSRFRFSEELCVQLFPRGGSLLLEASLPVPP